MPMIPIRASLLEYIEKSDATDNEKAKQRELLAYVDQSGLLNPNNSGVSTNAQGIERAVTHDDIRKIVREETEAQATLTGLKNAIEMLQGKLGIRNYALAGFTSLLVGFLLMAFLDPEQLVTGICSVHGGMNACLERMGYFPTPPPPPPGSSPQPPGPALRP
jgi:hypothetical protein